MKIVIAQPVHENGVIQLEEIASSYKKADFLLFPEGYLQKEIWLHEVQIIAKKYNINIVTSYRKNKKDLAVIIGRNGKILYQRFKTSAANEEPLQQPLQVMIDGCCIGYLLCMEILKGERDLNSKEHMDLIFHPIGVGMYSEEQLTEWISTAKIIAIKNQTYIFGTSHADGSYKNCGVSIPIAYGIDPNGEEIFLYKNKIQPVLVDLSILDTVEKAKKL